MEHGHEQGGQSAGERLRSHHRQFQWAFWVILLLGLWMVMAPLTFGYGTDVATPSGGRQLWLSDGARVAAMRWSDILSGALLVIFGWRSLIPDRPISGWVCAVVGAWLSLAPVILWAPSSAAYLNATTVGAVVIALSLLVPGMPNMPKFMKMGPATPPGWSYNPSSWPQRWILIALAFAGWMISRHLAAYQMGYIDGVWEPFFGAGSVRVLDSDMSHGFPVSDAALGATAFTFEFLMGWMGSAARWRTMPWMVTFFGILVIPLGLVHVLLVMSQPVVVGEWCTLCLAAAAVMLPMISLAADEVVAMVQHVRQGRRRGENGWRVFWLGGQPEEATEDERTPKLLEVPAHPLRLVRSSVWGMSAPWSLTLATLLGVFLMATPGIFGIAPPSSHVFHLAGALVVTTSVIAMGEVLRPARYFNLVLALALVGAPLLMSDAPAIARLLGIASGAVLIALSLPRGRIEERYGSFQRAIV